MAYDIPQGNLITPHVPNITGAESPKLDDVGAGIVSAAAKGADIMLRKQAIQGQLMKMDLAMERSESAHNLAILRMAQDNEQFKRTTFLREKEYERKQGDSDFRERKYYDTLKDQGDYMAEAATIDPNDPLAWNKALEIESRHTAGASTPGARRVKYWIGDQYNKKTAAEKAWASTAVKEIDKYINLWNWQGFRPTSEPLDNPGYWQTAYKMKPDGITPELDAKGEWVVDPTSKAYMLGHDALGNPHFLTQKKEVIDDYLDRWQRVKVAGKKEQVTDYESGVRPYPVDQTGGTAGAIPLPADKSQWIMHQPYTLKGRNYMFDGANLIPVR